MCAWCVCLAVGLPLSAIAQPGMPATPAMVSSPTPSNPVAERYRIEIDSLSREITTDKAHRTALATRMDDVRQALQDLDSAENRVNEKKPSLDEGLSNIDRDIADLEDHLNRKIAEFALHKARAADQPAPTLLEDALGSAAGIDKHRTRAMQNYLLFKAGRDIKRSRKQQNDLRARKVALAQTSELMLDTIGGYRTDVADLTENRKVLELQFTELSAAIVQKQDRLEQLADRLKQIEQEPELARFSNHRGTLRDPTPGILQHRYAEPKAQGLLQWEGILIAAPLGQHIESVFDGTVVFADHMQGFGDVAIVDHGEGYMSLYGMADFLVVEPGQQLLAGETIGSVGRSIGNDESTLYFEIRHNANTLNPENWLGLQRISLDSEP